jgi:hypothetical protein
MMQVKTVLSGFFFLILSYTVTAQQYDKTWVLGQYMSSLTFSGDSVIPALLPNNTIQSYETIANICDTGGNLLFYTNGVNVYNIQGNIMVNGDSLSAPSEYYDQVIQEGMPGRQDAIILPKPDDNNLYYIFHCTPSDTLCTINGAGYEPLNLYYSIVDMRMDNGRGAVVSKNNPIIQGEILSASRLAACRHANGRDWWIVKNAWHENIYYEFLLTPDTLLGPFIQQIGSLYGAENELPGYSNFSPDGSKYASVTAVSYVILMDFDRCTGLFSNPDSFYNNQYATNTNSVSGGLSVAFSPNNRFLYVTDPNVLNQYDLHSAQIHDSVRIETDTEFYEMNTLQLAPNNKIYISCFNGGSYKIHVINQPDSLGLACDFQLFGQDVLSLNPQCVPYFPNFRLGALVGSGCDTLTAIQAIADAHPAFASVSPNPATDQAKIIYYTGSNTANKAMLYDMNGQLVWSTNVSGSSGNISLDVSALPAGIYFVRFIADGKELLSSKLVVMR